MADTDDRSTDESPPPELEAHDIPELYTGRSSKQGFRLSYALSIAVQLGFIIAASVAGFVLLGVWLDRLLGTGPVFLVAGIISSVVLTFYEVYHMLIPLIRHDNETDQGS